MRTYGTVGYDGKHFVIACEPHVVIRLKRVFARISGQQHGCIKVTATEETARDLEWFMERFPMEPDGEAARVLASRAAAHRVRMDTVDAILAGRMEIPDFGLALPLRDYQRTAAEIAFQRRALLLADDVGLGKTAAEYVPRTEAV